MLAVPPVSTEESAFTHSVVEAGQVSLERRGRFRVHRIVPEKDRGSRFGIVTAIMATRIVHRPIRYSL